MKTKQVPPEENLKSSSPITILLTYFVVENSVLI